MCAMKCSNYHIALCDDDEKLLLDLKDKIEKEFMEHGIDVDYHLFCDPLHLLTYINEEQMDMLFLDIDMPSMSGMEVARALQMKGQSPLLIFVTNYDALVYDSFQYHPFSFIRKSHFNLEIKQVVTSIISFLEKKKETFTFSNGAEYIRLNIDDLIYFEADSNYVKLVTSKEVYRFRTTLRMLEEELMNKGFIRIHKGFLVNQIFVHTIRAADVELTNGVLLPISRTNKEEVRKQLFRYMR